MPRPQGTQHIEGGAVLGAELSWCCVLGFPSWVRLPLEVCMVGSGRAAARPLPGVLSSLARGILETVTAWPLWTQPLFHLTNIYRAPTVIQVLFWVLGTCQ